MKNIELIKIYKPRNITLVVSEQAVSLDRYLKINKKKTFISKR